MTTTTSRLTVAALVSAFTFSLAACGNATAEPQALGPDAQSTAPLTEEARELRKEVIGVYMEKLVATDNALVAEESILSYYSAEERAEREARMERYGKEISEERFTENHPDFSIETVEWDEPDASTVTLSWVAELECGTSEDHGTAFLVDVQESADGGYEVTKFSHATGCACASCVQA